jgi:fructosamine-3-kinase
MSDTQLLQAILDVLEPKTGKITQINHEQLAGGDINQALLVRTNHGNFFVKYNNARLYPDMFKQEATGLRLLSQANELGIPEIIGTGSTPKTSFLILEYIQTGTAGKDFMYNFGTKLAGLHRHTHETFGLHSDNYIGSLRQSNKPHLQWIPFFIHERLLPQVKMARDNGLLSKRSGDSFSRLFVKLEGILPSEPPALVHGDLWNGNYLCSESGEPFLIDPAAYYGHREADISMTKLFGGFSPEFYQAYQSSYPMEPGWQARTEIFNLYPLLVHVNLFGGGYVDSVNTIVRKF